MVIVPSLDVRGSQVSNDPGGSLIARARTLVDEGAEELHLVDLDRAETGASKNLDFLAELARESGVPCRLAGGISSIDDARKAIDRGFAGVLFSSAVFGDDELLQSIASLGGAGIVEIEARAGVRALYLIDVTTEGLLAGPPLALVDAVRAVVGRGVALHAGGGVRDLDDIRALALRGVASVVIGRALAENRFTIRAARQASAA